MLVSNWENTLKGPVKKEGVVGASKAELAAKVKELAEVNRKLRIKNLVLETKLVQLKDKETALNAKRLLLNFKKISVPLLIRQESMIEALRNELNNFTGKKNIQGDFIGFLAKNFESVLDGSQYYIKAMSDLCRDCELLLKGDACERLIISSLKGAMEANSRIEEVTRRVLLA